MSRGFGGTPGRQIVSRGRLTGEPERDATANPAGSLRPAAPEEAAASDGAARLLDLAELKPELEGILDERPELLPPLLDSLDEILRDQTKGGRW